MYILHRLKIAGRENPIFTDDSLRVVYENSGGIPRRINQICDMSLFTAFGIKVKSIDGEIVQDAVDSLGV